MDVGSLSSLVWSSLVYLMGANLSFLPPLFLSLLMGSSDAMCDVM